MAIGWFAGLLLLDQLVKYQIASNMLPGESIAVVPGFFHITYVLNPGGAFGILANQRAFFVIAGLLLIGGFIKYYPRLRQQDRFFFYGCVSLLTGAVGNLLDRIRSGFVIDFFDFRVWPVFNLADIAIVAGVISMMYALLFRMKETDD